MTAPRLAKLAWMRMDMDRCLVGMAPKPRDATPANGW